MSSKEFLSVMFGFQNFLTNVRLFSICCVSGSITKNVVAFISLFNTLKVPPSKGNIKWEAPFGSVGCDDVDLELPRWKLSSDRMSPWPLWD